MLSKRAVIIYNPMSGRPGHRAKNVKSMVGLLKERCIEAEIHATKGPNDATKLARCAIEKGINLVISYGGDGTINEIIQGMIGSEAALAIWAGGTSNVVAHDLGLPFKMKRLADVIASGKIKRIPLGRAHPCAFDQTGIKGLNSNTEKNNKVQERYFFMFAGIGLDSSIARSVNPRLKRLTGEFAFWVSGIRHLFTWNPELFEVEIDGKKYESVFTLVAKGKGYGGGICITPNARLEDPWFEVFIMPRQASKISYLRDFIYCFRGNSGMANAITVKGQCLKAISGDKPWVQLDGEVIGPLPMTFDVVTNALSIIIP